MNVYDFDNTIYSGESTVDFFLFCLKKDKRLLKYLPTAMFLLAKYKLCLITLDDLAKYVEKYADDFFHMINNVDDLVKEFWDTHINKIKSYYLLTKKDDDIIMSASFNILLNDISKRIGIKNCICSVLNTQTGKLEQICFRENKVSIFRKLYGNSTIDKFFTDSKNDKPMIDIAKTAYMVKGDSIKRIK